MMRKSIFYYNLMIKIQINVENLNVNQTVCILPPFPSPAPPPPPLKRGSQQIFLCPFCYGFVIFLLLCFYYILKTITIRLISISSMALFAILILLEYLTVKIDQNRHIKYLKIIHPSFSVFVFINTILW